MNIQNHIFKIQILKFKGNIMLLLLLDSGMRVFHYCGADAFIVVPLMGMLFFRGSGGDGADVVVIEDDAGNVVVGVRGWGLIGKDCLISQ